MARTAWAEKFGPAFEVFAVFLGLGLTAFGGPLAHIAYFRETFVVRRKWLSEAAYADLVALCQMLPGPASSQVGMAIGLMRAGYAGMLAAWLAFTMPSALLLVGFAHALGTFGAAEGAGWLQGLKAAAVAVVAHALIGMARSLAPDRERAAIALVGMLLAMLVAGAPGQILAILAGGAAGLIWLRPDPAPSGPGAVLGGPANPFVARLSLVLFFVLLLVLPLLAPLGGALALVDAFYRAGALVFGGGHVVLPLLQAETVDTGLVGRELFLAGYGAAQAVPGPLFSFAAFLGSVGTREPAGLIGAALALGAIFLPSALLILGGLPLWERLRSAPRARRALTGVNAAVVGLIAAALYDPVFTTGITGPPAMAVAAAAFVALAAWRLPAWAVVIVAGVVGQVLL